MYVCFIRISKIQFCLHWEDATAATGNLPYVTLWTFMEYTDTLNFHEQPKLNLNETYIGPLFAEKLALI